MTAAPNGSAPAVRSRGALRTLFYGVLWVVARLLFAVWFRYRVRGRPTPFPRGPLVVAANHVSYLDPVALALALKRPVTYLITSGVARKLLFRPWVWLFDCIVVEESGINVEALRQAIAVLRGGGVVGIFPEGAISDHGCLAEGQLGVASLLLQGHAPVLTAAIVGTFESLPRGGGFPRPGPIEIRWSRLVLPDAIAADRAPREARRELRDQVMAGIAAVLPVGMGGQAVASPPSA